jgi:hypothetical protein
MDPDKEVGSRPGKPPQRVARQTTRAPQGIAPPGREATDPAPREVAPPADPTPGEFALPGAVATGAIAAPGDPAPRDGALLGGEATEAVATPADTAHRGVAVAGREATGEVAPRADSAPREGAPPGDPAPREVVLVGGRMTRGVVRVGDTVRRPGSPFAGLVLKHLERRGFGGAPRWVGRDEAGRDVLSFLPGWVPGKLQTWTDAQVWAAGALARELHEATRGSGLAGSHPVVCHHDLGPNNAVFRDDVPVAFIDFDLAAPGSPLEDVGYMAWLWCVSSKPGAPSVEAQATQVRVLADGYGLSARERELLVDAMLERQSRNARFWGELPSGSVDATQEQIAERIAWSRREHAFTAEHRRVFAAALG